MSTPTEFSSRIGGAGSASGSRGSHSLMGKTHDPNAAAGVPKPPAAPSPTYQQVPPVFETWHGMRLKASGTALHRAGQSRPGTQYRSGPHAGRSIGEAYNYDLALWNSMTHQQRQQIARQIFPQRDTEPDAPATMQFPPPAPRERSIEQDTNGGTVKTLDDPLTLPKGGTLRPGQRVAYDANGNIVGHSGMPNPPPSPGAGSGGSFFPTFGSYDVSTPSKTNPSPLATPAPPPAATQPASGRVFDQGKDVTGVIDYSLAHGKNLETLRNIPASPTPGANDPTTYLKTLSEGLDRAQKISDQANGVMAAPKVTATINTALDNATKHLQFPGQGNVATPTPAAPPAANPATPQNTTPVAAGSNAQPQGGYFDQFGGSGSSTPNQTIPAHPLPNPAPPPAPAPGFTRTVVGDIPDLKPAPDPLVPKSTGQGGSYRPGLLPSVPRYDDAGHPINAQGIRLDHEPQPEAKYTHVDQATKPTAPTVGSLPGDLNILGVPPVDPNILSGNPPTKTGLPMPPAAGGTSPPPNNTQTSTSAGDAINRRQAVANIPRYATFDHPQTGVQTPVFGSDEDFQNRVTHPDYDGSGKFNSGDKPSPDSQANQPSSTVAAATTSQTP